MKAIGFNSRPTKAQSMKGSSSQGATESNSWHSRVKESIWNLFKIVIDTVVNLKSHHLLTN